MSPGEKLILSEKRANSKSKEKSENIKKKKNSSVGARKLSKNSNH